MKTKMKRPRAWCRKNSIGKYNGSLGSGLSYSTQQIKHDKPALVAKVDAIKKAIDASC